ncbi:MAG: DUF2513 domain-containing protein [Chloroflexi bacterium]|nr:DUF2513 domain-containing protein [Chloroflexota bacterium]
MKRDMAVIRCLLEYIEAHDKMFQPIHFDDDTFRLPAERVQYHLRLIEDAGFVRTKGTRQGYLVVEELTWSGHEYLAQLRATAASS